MVSFSCTYGILYIAGWFRWFLSVVHMVYCILQVGLDGSPCFHQYVLWSRKLASCPNSLPILDACERQYFATGDFATGDALPILYYESIHPEMQYPEDHVEDLSVSFLLL